MARHDRKTGTRPLKAEASTPDTSGEATVDRSKIEALAKKLDVSNMKEVIERLPAQIEVALAQDIQQDGGRPLPSGPFKRVVIAGMGGSALPMDVLTDAFADQLKVPVIVCRRYDLPPYLIDGSLIIASSFSGGTEEVLSAIGPVAKGANNVVVLCREDESAAKPAKLGRVAAENDYLNIRIPVHREPKGFQPRSAVGYTVTFLARVLSHAGVLDNPQIELEAVVPFLRQEEIRESAEETAYWLRDRIPVVYTDEMHLMSVARIAKIKFNENSKRPAFFNAFPEANHNEMIGFLNETLGRFGLLYLHDCESHPRIQRRYHVMMDVFERQKLAHVDFKEWKMPGDTRVKRIFAALAFADWCSYTLALLDGRDPTPVELVETFKRELEAATGH